MATDLVDTSTPAPLIWEAELEADIERCLSAEVSLVVLDTVCVVEQVVAAAAKSARAAPVPEKSCHPSPTAAGVSQGEREKIPTRQRNPGQPRHPP